jgi:hypothetical protein
VNDSPKKQRDNKSIFGENFGIEIDQNKFFLSFFNEEERLDENKDQIFLLIYTSFYF